MRIHACCKMDHHTLRKSASMTARIEAQEAHMYICKNIEAHVCVIVVLAIEK